MPFVWEMKSTFLAFADVQTGFEMISAKESGEIDLHSKSILETGN